MEAKSKRIQVKNACVNCQRACKKCDDERPCLRCKRYGLGETCVDSQRKPRQRGIKRGPYKKRAKQIQDPVRTPTTSPDVVTPMSTVTAISTNTASALSVESNKENSPLSMLSDVALTSTNSRNSCSPRIPPPMLASRINVFHPRSIPISTARFDTTKYNATSTGHRRHQQSIQN
ncbi:hypothetical protein EV175_001664 [Coemansia sp. RSA 1933]|nr:hypothetical protein EV175_001664 [Coemansia sp. RSA 1933]